MRALLEESLRAAVAAADPLRILAPYLPRPPLGRTFVAAAGKAAASMALAAERNFQGELEGIAITRYGHGLPTRRIRVLEAGHPVPDEAGEAAAREILAKVTALREGDLLLALLSGGGSSLLSLPAPDVSMPDLKQVTRALLRSGATIQEINTVRKHLSAIHGGRLAAASPAPVCALIISDVTGMIRRISLPVRALRTRRHTRTRETCSRAIESNRLPRSKRASRRAGTRRRSRMTRFFPA